MSLAKECLYTVMLWCGMSASIMAQPTNWKCLDIHKGLSSDCVMDIAQDSKGRIWMATDCGLNLYEGNRIYTFTRSRQPQKENIIANDLNRVWPDPVDPVVWIATQRNGLDEYNYLTGTFVHHQAGTQPGSIADNSVTSVSPSRSGGLWLTSYMGGISHYNRRTRSFTLVNSRTIPSLVSDAMWCVEETSDSLLCVGHVRNGISFIDLRHKRARNIPVIHCFPNNEPAEDGVRDLLTDSLGRLWLATEKGLACLPPHSPQPLSISGIKGLVCRLHLCRNILWISTRDMGLWTLDLNTVSLPETCPPNTSVSVELKAVAIPCFAQGETSLIRCALRDRYGNLWVGTDRKGVQVELHERPMFHYKATPTSMRTLEQDTQGRIWAGTQSEGIVITDKEGDTHILNTSNSALQSNTITALQRTPDGDMWIGTEMQGLYRWNHHDGSLRKIYLRDSDGGTTIYVCSLTMWNGLLAAGTYQGLFLIHPENEAFTCYTEKNSPLPTQYIFSLLPDSKGNLWCGTSLNGLTVLKPDMSLHFHLRKTDSLPDKTITHMLEAHDGSIWGTTDDGLIHITPTPKEGCIVKVLREEEGLIHSVIQALNETDGKHIWCSTPDGLYLINRTDSGQAYRTVLCYPAIHTGKDIFRINTALSLSEKYILWGGDGYLHMYMPDHAPSNTPLPFYVSVSDSGKNEYTLTLNIPDIALTDKMEFKYRLDKEAWQFAGGIRNISLGRLTSGTHTIEITPRIIGYEWNGQSTVRTRINVPHPWMRVILWSAGGLVVFMLLYVRLVRRPKKPQTCAAPSDCGNASSSANPVPDEKIMLSSAERVLSAADKELLAKAEKITDRLIQETDFDKNRLAQELCISTSTLYRRLKAATGMSPNEFIRRQRLLRAHQLLLSGRSVSETASLVGMSITYLGRCYKEEYGISPSEVRP